MQGHPKQLQMQRHVCASLCELPPGEGGPQPHTSHCGWQSPPLPWQLRHTYCWRDHCQATSQQRHLSKEHMLLHHRSEEFLPQHTHGPTGIHAHETQQPPSQFCQIIWPHKPGQQWRYHQCQKTEGHVGSPTSGHPQTTSPWKTTLPTRLPTKQGHAGPLEKWLAAYLIHFLCQQLCHQVRQAGALQTSRKSLNKQTFHWLGRLALHWHEHGLGLRRPQGPRLDDAYVPEALMQFQHQAPNKPQHQPYPHVKPNYVAKAQYAEDMDTLTLLPKEDKKSSRRSLALSSIMHDALAALCLRHWGLSLHNRQTRLRTQRKRYDNFWTMPLLILMQSSGTMQMTWSLQVTATHCTSQNQRHAARQAGRQTFLHVQQLCQTTKPWRHPHNCTNNESGHVLSGRGQGGSSLHKLQRGHPRLPYSWIHGSSPSSDKNANGQHHCTRHCQQQRHQKLESYGNEIPLAPRQRKLWPISTLLGPRQRKQRWLRDKTSCHHSSPSTTPDFCHKHLYLTSFIPTTHRQSSCSKGVLDIHYTTVWYNLHAYSMLHNEPLRPPVCTKADRDQQSHQIFIVLRKQLPR